MTKQPKCCLCGGPCERWHEDTDGYGHNPEPLASWPQRCCNTCNDTRVIPARIFNLLQR